MKRKHIFLILAFLFLGLLAYGVNFAIQFALVGSSYASKITCSCYFLSGRNVEDIKKNDLYAVPFADIVVDEKHQKVTSSIYGIAKTEAVYRPGYGCTLLNGIRNEELKSQQFTYNRNAVSHEFERVSVSTYFDSVSFYSLIAKAFQDPDRKLQTRAIIILKDGKLVFEKYGEGFTRNTRLTGWSMTKSITNAMVGIMVKEGKLEISKPAPVKAWKQDERKSITINDLLHMSSGLKFEENYAKPSDATKMLFTSYSAAKVAMQAEPEEKPGVKFYYSSGSTNIIQEIIREQFSTLKDYQSFPYKKLFDKIGMSSAVMEPDASGTFVGSSFMYATAQDWARFGQLYLQKGIWNGEQILPEGWTKYSAEETPNSEGRYAAHFWVNHHFPEYPKDGYFASGFEGQYVNILPSQNMVVVRLGCSQRGVKFDNAAFVSDLVKLLKPVKTGN